MMTAGFFAVAAVLILAIRVPAIGVTACGLALVVQIALMCIRPWFMRWHRPEVANRPLAGSPVFSVHIATHNEPPDMVIRTLSALLEQTWAEDDFEIIVMDNNTVDPGMWRPVEAFSSRHPGRIRFIHQLGVEGAKSGALNIALDYTRFDATHIVTVDADYIVYPNFLATAANALERTGSDYVQFPQAYTRASDDAAGVDAELEEYFRSNAQSADVAEAVLLTGTLCVISRNALVAVGGWSGATTTEDADMGVRLCNAGHTGRFINHVVGHGLLPFSLNDLEKQRYRWCSGNFQTLLRHFQIVFGRASQLNLQKRLVVFSQLTAWFNLTLIPAVILLANLIIGADHPVVTGLAAFVIILSFLDTVVRIAGRGLRGDRGAGVVLRAIAGRIALAPVSARATLDAVLGRELKFVVTDKSGNSAGGASRLPFVHLALFVAAIAALVVGVSEGGLVLTAVFILMLPLPAAIVTDRSLRACHAALQRSNVEMDL